MNAIKLYDRFINLLPILIPSFLILLFTGWIASSLLITKLKNLSPYPDSPLFYGGMTPADLSHYFTSGSPSFSLVADIESATFYIISVFLFYFSEKYAQAQRNSGSLISFNQFARKVQRYGLLAYLIITVVLILNATLQVIQAGHSNFFTGQMIPGFVALPFMFIFMSFWCFVYSVVRYEILKKGI